VKQLVKHLKYSHDIKILSEEYDMFRYIKPDVYLCKICDEKIRLGDKKIHREKCHPRYYIPAEKKSLGTIRKLLDFVDKKYGVHCCFVKGLTRRRVFLDGVTREKKI